MTPEEKFEKWHMEKYGFYEKSFSRCRYRREAFLAAYQMAGEEMAEIFEWFEEMRSDVNSQHVHDYNKNGKYCDQCRKVDEHSPNCWIHLLSQVKLPILSTKLKGGECE